MLKLSDKWIDFLVTHKETGMGYHIVSVILRDGRRYDRVVVDSGYITQVKGYDNIPFSEEDVVDIIITHDKWDFDEK